MHYQEEVVLLGGAYSLRMCPCSLLALLDSIVSHIRGMETSRKGTRSIGEKRNGEKEGGGGGDKDDGGETKKGGGDDDKNGSDESKDDGEDSMNNMMVVNYLSIETHI
jgi:hypothetical protein